MKCFKREKQDVKN